MRTPIRKLAVILAAFALGGCYSYVPAAGPEALRDGGKVRVYLTDQGVLNVADRLGPGVAVLEGDVLSARTDSIILAVRHLKTRTRGEVLWNGETFTVPRSQVALLEGQRFSRWRSIAALGLVALGAYALSTQTGIIGDAIEIDENPRPGGPTQ